MGTQNHFNHKTPHSPRVPQLDEFFKSSGFQMQSLSEQRITVTTSLNSSNLPNTPQVLRTIEKTTGHVRTFGKFFRRLQQLDAKKFVLLPICTDIVLYYWNKVVQSTEVSPELINGIPKMIIHFVALAERRHRYPVCCFSCSNTRPGYGSFPREP